MKEFEHFGIYFTNLIEKDLEGMPSAVFKSHGIH